MSIRSTFGKGVIAIVAWAGLAGLTPLATIAQEGTPAAPPPLATPVAATAGAIDVPLIDASGAAVGLATFSEGPNGVTVTVLIEGLTPGEHGWHLHEMGVCEPVGGAEPFADAGGHWNPTMMPHGGPEDDERHVGDFGNLAAAENGLAEAQITTSDFTLGGGPTSVFNEDGTAIVVHERMEDLTTQPDGARGHARWHRHAGRLSRTGFRPRGADSPRGAAPGALPLADGEYAVQSITDPNSLLKEGDEARENNTATTSFTVRNGEITDVRHKP